MSRGFSRDLRRWTMDLNVWVKNALGGSENLIYAMPKGFPWCGQHLPVAAWPWQLILSLMAILSTGQRLCCRGRTVYPGSSTQIFGPCRPQQSMEVGGPGLGWGGTVQIPGKVCVLDKVSQMVQALQPPPPPPTTYPQASYFLGTPETKIQV